MCGIFNMLHLEMYLLFMKGLYVMALVSFQLFI